MTSEEKKKSKNESNIETIIKFEELLNNIHKLKDKNYGCPWQKIQTHKSLTPYLLEESYELINAINNNNFINIKEELGDILLQVLLHCEIGLEEKNFILKDVISLLNTKIKNRHPYIFKKKKKVSLDEAKTIWTQIKKKEKLYQEDKKISSILLNKLKYLQPTTATKQINYEVEKFGFRWQNLNQILDKMAEEIEELKKAIKNSNKNNIREEFGDIYFTLISLSLFLEINHEDALRDANKKFLSRFSFIEDYKNAKIKNNSLLDFNKLWSLAKKTLEDS